MTKTYNTSEHNQFNDFLRAEMKDLAFASGGQLSEILAAKFDVSKVYARKIVQRATKANILKSSKPYIFGKGQFIYILPNNELEFEYVMQICQSSKPPMYRLMLSLLKNQGILSKYDAIKIAGTPNGKSSTKVETIDDIIKVLSRMDFVYEQKDTMETMYIIQKKNFERLPELQEKELMQDCYNKMVIDCSLIPDVLRWLNNINLIDNQTSTPIYRNKKIPSIGAIHNNILWDAFSYTKTTGINAVVGSIANIPEKQTLVVLDVVLSEEYSETLLDGFYSRVQINRNSVKTAKRKVFPIVIFKKCSDFVSNRLRKLGFLAIDVGSIFGSKVYSVISRLSEINSSIFTSNGNIEKLVENILEDIRDVGLNVK